MAWNREHAGVAAAPAVAIDWSVIAMTEAAWRSPSPGPGPAPVAAAVGETVWWVTLVDATLVRYHPRDYESALASTEVRRRKTERTLEGLRYVRNQLGKSVEPDEFVCPAVGDNGAGGLAWRPLPEPGLEGLGVAGPAMGAEQVPRLSGAAGRARHRPDLYPLHSIPRPGRGFRRPQLLTAPSKPVPLCSLALLRPPYPSHTHSVQGETVMPFLEFPTSPACRRGRRCTGQVRSPDASPLILQAIGHSGGSA